MLLRIVPLGSLALVLTMFSCSGAASPADPSATLAEGAVDPLPATSSWATFCSFTGKAIKGHLWGRGTYGDYEFHAGHGDLALTSSGVELLAYGSNSAGGTTQNHLVRFACDGNGRPQSAELYTTLIDSWALDGAHLLPDGVWIWHADSYSQSVEIHHSLMDKPDPDTSPFYQRGQRLRCASVGDPRSSIDESGAPWFRFGLRAYTPPEPRRVYPDSADLNGYVCERCQEFAGVGLVDPFVVGRTLYWPAFGQTSGALSPARLVIFTPQKTAAGTQSETTFYIEDIFATYADPPLDFSEYRWFRSHVAGGLAYLTWIGQKASQIVFDPAEKSFTVRMQGVDVGDLDPDQVMQYRFDDHGDLYFLEGTVERASVRKLSPSGLAPVGGPIEPSQAPVAGASKYFRFVEGLYIAGDKPYVVVVGNGLSRVEPQLSIVVPR